MFVLRHKVAAVLMGLALVSTACESDKFAQAPTASAPDRAEAQAPQASPPARPTRSQNMPADHPPVAQGGGQMGGGQTGSVNGSVAPPKAGPQGMSPEQYGKVGPLRWNTPESWSAVKPASNMRLAEYHLPAEQGGQPATMTAFYFGKGGGGAVQANIDRWVGQFQQVSGKPAQTTRSVNGMKVHLVDASGTFTVGAAMGGGQPEPDWRMRGAIVESPEGNFFFKLTGPKATVAAHEKGFESFVSSFQAASGGQ